MKQHLYVLLSASGLCKVGIAMSPEIRRKSLEAASGHKTSIYCVFGPFNAARRIESMVHTALAEHRAEGEWFTCAAEHANQVATALSGGFVDDPGESDEEVVARDEARAQALVSMFGFGADFAADDKLIAQHKDLVDRYAKLSDEFLEAAELVDYYAEMAKDTMFIARKAMDQVLRLEAQLIALRAANADH